MATNDAGAALQKAIYDALSAQIEAPSPPVAVGLYDYVDENASYPYIVIGESTIVDDGNKTSFGQDHTFTLHVWDQNTDNRTGRLRAREIMGLIYEALHEKSLTVEGQSLVLCKFDFSSGPDFDADGKTVHGVTRYRIKTQPST
ncbi:MAG: DUF3168 domain-containing protein [Alphaproteobacteria bacterium]